MVGSDLWIEADSVLSVSSCEFVFDLPKDPLSLRRTAGDEPVVVRRLSPHSKPPARGLKLRATLTIIYPDSAGTNMLVSVPGWSDRDTQDQVALRALCVLL